MKLIKLFEEFKEYSSRRGHPTIMPREVLLDIHDSLLYEYGGILGIRDHGLLDSTLSRPYISAFGEEVYPTDSLKLAAFLHGMVKQHPLADVNKRTGFSSAEWILNKDGGKFKISYDDARPFLSKLATEELSVGMVEEWLKKVTTIK